MTVTPSTGISLSELRERLSQRSLSIDDAAAFAAEACTLIRGETAGDDASSVPLSILSELTLCGSQPIEEAATRVLFRDLIEPLNDSFDSHRAERADRVMAQLIQRYNIGESSPERRMADASDTSRLLARRLRAASHTPQGSEKVKRIIVLSRITVGADVAVTSVILDHLKRVFPQQELVLVGPAKLRQLLGGDHRLSFLTVEYQRTALLRDRLAVSISLGRALEEATASLGDEEYLVVDPDSRMTQLGLLPPIKNLSQYLLFDSRRASEESEDSLAEIARQWCAQRWPVESDWKALPYVAPVADSAIASLRTLLDDQGRRQVIFVSLGVGGNERKRLQFDLESNLIDRIASRAALILDCGATEQERAHTARHAARLREGGCHVISAAEYSPFEALPSGADVLVWDGGIGSFSVLVSASDAYIGYDSAGQHIAAALARPVLTLFSQGETERFADRWRATGRGPSRTLLFNPHDTATSIIDLAMEMFAEILVQKASDY